MLGRGPLAMAIAAAVGPRVLQILNAQWAMRLIAEALGRRHDVRILMLGAITDLFEPRSNLEHYEAALEASCDALIALQLISASAAGSSAKARGAEVQSSRAIKSLRRTIKSLRRAIEEMRATSSEGANTPIVGFVLDTAPGHSGDPYSGDRV